jgi:parallel beta-helix repeat protein
MKSPAVLMLIIILFSSSFLVYIQLVKAEGTIYIRADGSIDPPTAPICSSDNVTYVFTDNIEFDKSIFVERDSIVIDGAGYTVEGTGTGIGFGVGGRTNVTIKNVKVEMREYGIYLGESTYCSIIGSNVTGNGWGIALYPHAHHNSIVGNNMTANGCGIWGGEEHCSSNHNMISENNIAGSNPGIYLAGSWSNSIIGNNITGIGQGSGISLDWCSTFNILRNNVTHCQYGMRLYKSSNCSIVGNDIARNDGYGIVTQLSENVIYHNSFVNNANKVVVSDSANVWDDDYPSGGNYWSDCNGVDIKNGPGQDLPGSDCIGDTPYIIDADNVDHYPLMNPYGVPAPQTYGLAIAATVGGTTVPAPGTYTYTTNSTVQVTATPNNTGYLFDYWELDSVNAGSNNPHTVYMEENHTLNAVFRLEIYDVAVTTISLSRTVVGEAYSANINVTVANLGDFTENFNVTVYVNTTTIATLTNIALTSGASTTITLAWNTAGFAYGNYSLSAHASPVEGETATEDNTLFGGWVFATIPGDINGDQKVNVLDAILIANSFNSKPCNTNWNPNADTNCDDKVNILDCIVLANHFNQSWP